MDMYRGGQKKKRCTFREGRRTRAEGDMEENEERK